MYYLASIVLTIIQAMVAWPCCAASLAFHSIGRKRKEEPNLSALASASAVFSKDLQFVLSSWHALSACSLVTVTGTWRGIVGTSLLC
jgi:hypothetical protein